MAYSVLKCMKTISDSSIVGKMTIGIIIRLEY